MYSVQIDKGGRVVFEGVEFVNKVGRHQWQLPHATLDAISRNIDDRQILELTQTQLDGACDDEVFDVPTTRLKVTRNQQSVVLLDDGQCGTAGVVSNFRRFCQEVDESIGTSHFFCKAGDCDKEAVKRHTPR